MSRLSCITPVMLLVLAGGVQSSGERNLEVATEMTCEELLYDATTLFGTLTDVEYAVSFVLEARESVSERYTASGGDPASLAELYKSNLEISRAVAMHRLFQEPKCPTEKDWYQYKPTKIGKQSLWD